MKRRILALLASVLIASLVGLLAVGICGGIHWLLETRPPKGRLSQEQIVAEIERNHGSVDYDETAPGRPVVGVGLRIGSPADTLLQYVAGLPQVRELGLRQTDVTDAGLEYVEGLSHLEVLELSRTKITDAGLVYFKGLTHLKYLGLDRTRITGAGFAWLKALTHLETLTLHDTKLTDADVRCLADHLRALPRVRYVEIGYNPMVSDSMREELKKALPNVTVE